MDQPSPTSKTNQAKRNLDLSGKEKEAPTQSGNILNLPYSDSEEEREEGVDLTEQWIAEQEEFPSPTPRKGQDEQIEETSLRKPRSRREKRILEQIHELEILDREIKRNNARLTKKNKELHNSFMDMRGIYVLLKRRNMRLVKYNTSMYRMIRILMLEVNISK